MSFIDAFFGSTQSQFTAYAIFAAVISICISIILTGTDMTIGNRFLLIFFVILAVLPSILLMLLQITCMVTGGDKNDRWWCWLYSWIIAIFVIIYCVLVIIISLTSLFTYNNAISKVDMNEQNNKMTPENSNNYAKMMIHSNSKEEIEKFMNSTEEDEEQGFESDVQQFTNKNGGMPSPDMTMPQQEIQKFISGSPSNANEIIQKFTNGGIIQSLIPSGLKKEGKESYVNKEEEEEHKIPLHPSSIKHESTQPTKNVESFSPSEILEDHDPEPFTNRNYASFR